MQFTCDHCTRRARLMCEECHTPYCSVECQNVAWKIGNHQLICGKRKADGGTQGDVKQRKVTLDVNSYWDIKQYIQEVTPAAIAETRFTDPWFQENLEGNYLFWAALLVINGSMSEEDFNPYGANDENLQEKISQAGDDLMFLWNANFTAKFKNVEPFYDQLVREHATFDTERLTLEWKAPVVDAFLSSDEYTEFIESLPRKYDLWVRVPSGDPFPVSTADYFSFQENARRVMQRMIDGISEDAVRSSEPTIQYYSIN